MDARCARLELDAVASALLHDFRFFEIQLVNARDHDAVAGVTRILYGLGDLVVLRLDRGELRQQRHQISVVLDIEAGLL